MHRNTFLFTSSWLWVVVLAVPVYLSLSLAPPNGENNRFIGGAGSWESGAKQGQGSVINARPVTRLKVPPTAFYRITDDVTLTRGPYLQMVSQTAATLRWRTNAAADSKIEVGTVHGSYTKVAANPDVTTEHEVRISGLAPGTKYYYRFGSSTQVLQDGADNFFVTAPANNSTQKVRMAVFGDCGKGNSTQQQVLNAYLEHVGGTPAELLLLLGDNAYEDGTDQDYQAGFFEPYGGTILKNHALFPAIGNHEYKTVPPDARDGPYYQIFSNPTQGQCGGTPSGSEAFYSFDWGNIHFLSLDSYGEEAGGSRLFDTLGPQVSWVKRDLAATTRQWIVVIFHHPPYAKGTYNSDTSDDLVALRENFIRILERYGVDLVLCGHSHVYERSYLLNGHYGKESSFDPQTHARSTSSGKYDGSANSCPYLTPGRTPNQGTVYVVAGSAATRNSDVENGFPHNALPFSTTDAGMLYLEVEDNRLDARFIRDDGVVWDRFTILKDVKKTATLPLVAGQPLTLSASWPGAYHWSNGATTRSITVTPRSDTTYTVSDGSNCLSDVFHIQVATAVSQPGIDSLLEVFPTPVKRGSPVTIRSRVNGAIDAVLVDNQGRRLRSFQFRSTTSLPTHDLPAGTYLLLLSSKAFLQANNKELVIERKLVVMQ